MSSKENPPGVAGAMSAEESAYVRSVEAAFLSLLGRGLMISPLDEQIILRWARGGVALETARRGVSRAFERFAERGDTGRARLLACEPFVRREHERAQRLALGAPAKAPEDPEARGRLSALIARLAERGGSEADERLRAAYRRAYRQLARLDGAADLKAEI